MAIELIILGLRRSGTTVFWQTFRQDPQLLCYDEPFNPHLGALPDAPRIKHPEEFRRLLVTDPAAFWERFSPIHYSEELRGGLSDRQREWLAWLGDSGERVAIDVTRCHYKIVDLARIAPAATLVYLYRPPASLATSHLLPSAAGWSDSWRRKIKRRAHERGFWTRRDRYDGWSFESIIGRSPISPFGIRLPEVDLDAERIYAMPAVGRLLAYWKLADARIRRDGAAAFGERFVCQQFDGFCREPRAVVETIYRRLRRQPPPALDLTGVHPPNRPHQPDSPLWERYLRELGIAAGAVE